MNTDDPTELLRSQLRVARDVAQAPSPVRLTEGALRQAHDIRNRRRATVAGVAAAFGVAAAVTAVVPGTAPAPSPAPASPGPTSTTPPPAPAPGWRVTERCDTSSFRCTDLTVDAFVVDGTTYRRATSGSQPWTSRENRSIQLSVGSRGKAHRVLGGVVGRAAEPGAPGVRASFDVYVDGLLTRHYVDAPLSLLEVGPGRHHVKVVAVGHPEPRQVVVVGDFAPVP